ncbi:putative allophanate hydrolase [Pusillimonas sp. T7-7]|uniref:acetyl-CoA carboxylase biotin carboxyl carrier protein subunit n=1 Tax=Pusillimonas sp. (strain T7-7) TaxID=1007105 RepID=UPI0002084E42|nr:acetyl-CoA carboxylase biotin carboxyl carrier protein subunit [Pusillimonas sp. T7-7]AEC21772.1 putative allophanate hydrolase [Pusillimonas sp. T7-7]
MSHEELLSDITGKVWKIEKAVGSQVAEGETVIVVESMKMEIPVAATVAGEIVEIKVKEGEEVSEMQVVAIINS